MTSLTSDFALTDEALDLLFREARTANTFTDEPVTAEQIRAIHDLTRLGPTAMNNQPMRLVLVESPEARERLLPLMSEGNRAKTATAPMVAILASDTAFHDRLPEHFPHAPGVQQMFEDNFAMREDQATMNAALEIGYFLIGIRAAGLAAGPMGGFDRAGIDAEFLSGTSWRSMVVVNIGHPGPDAWLERLPRITFDDAALVL